ncbi:FAD-dependent oxidoreductase [Candidatus Micrarchaeota archaeon]|nr:FAD-dependent oxidoreductase [Candidatus Micrarchaeota archaeon]
MYDLAIIGGGVSGFGAAMYAGRFELSTVLFAEQRGGTIVTTEDVANYPGFKLITGYDLAQKIEEHALEYKVEVRDEKVVEIKREADGTFSLKGTSTGAQAKTVILATGTEWRKLGAPGEKEYANKGVHYCALCDGAFYKGKVIGVIGGSDSATKESLLLATYGSKVYIFVRGEKLRAEPINLTRALNNPKIEIVTGMQVKEIKGENGKMKSVVLSKPLNGKSELALDALFVEIGHNALSGLAKQAGVELNEKGEVKIDRNCQTNVPGFYAVGDVADTEFKQAITGVAEGVIAAYSAYKHLGK